VPPLPAHFSPIPMSPDLPAKNVLGGPLRPCGTDPVTGFFRDGHCHTCAEDQGCHTVCVEVSAEFLAWQKAAGNDLSTPMPQYRFPGLKPGDRWCVCAGRWREAVEAGVAAPVVLAATHVRTLELVPLPLLQAHATS
jgi:uncharacterized protein